jgi:hypothetical protein
MRDIMADSRDSTRARPLKSTVSRKSKFGGEVLIYLLQYWKRVTQDTLQMTPDIRELTRSYCLLQK